MSPSGHLGMSSIPLSGVEAGLPASVEAPGFPVGTLHPAQGWGLAISRISPGLRGQCDRVVVYITFPQ